MTGGKRCFQIGSRKSKLALLQTEIVSSALNAEFPDYSFPVTAIATMGDMNLTMSLHSIGAKSLWTKELETLLLDGEIDMIVHSLKDIPTSLPKGCIIGSIMEREDPRDVIVMKHESVYTNLEMLPTGSVVGTSSLRRSAQLKRAYPHLTFQDIRGNVGTRLNKLDDPSGPFACIVLAAAGLIRLDLQSRITSFLSSDVCLHAVGQGALGIEIREHDHKTAKLVERLSHVSTSLRCTAERSLLRALEGGCSVPIGVNTTWESCTMKMQAAVVSIDGKQYVRQEKTGKVETVDEAENLGIALAKILLVEGAEEILDQIRTG